MLQVTDQIAYIWYLYPLLILNNDTTNTLLHTDIKTACNALNDFFEMLQTPIHDAIKFKPNIETYIENTIKKCI